MFEFLTNHPENLTGFGKETSELVCSTEVCGFENCEFISNKELADHLRETIPPSHLEGCPSIEFDPNHIVFVRSPFTLGFYECGSHAIHLGDESRFSDGIEGMKDTIIHEIGHNAYDEFIESNPELNTQWETLNSESWQKYLTDGTGFVSSYARTDKYEDFSESYMTYVRDPERLQFFSPEKYIFLHDYIFAGREYPPKVLTPIG
jgi:hypothetical protein